MTNLKPDTDLDQPTSVSPEQEIIDASTPRHWLIRSKLTPPRQQIVLAERVHLLSILDQGLHCTLGLVMAPAGFGKTTLLSQWHKKLRAEGIDVAWLTLDEDDNDIRQFLSCMIFAFDVSGLSLDHLLTHADKGLMESHIKGVIAAILGAVAQSEKRFVLVLDDYHRASSSDVDDAVSALISACPLNLTIVVSSRRHPDLDIARLVAAGQVIEIGVEALRFSNNEMRAVLGKQINPDIATKLMERTEGWAVAVQLARLANQNINIPSNVGESFDGNSKLVSAYLADQIVNDLPQDLRDFLMFTSILERYCAELANAVCGIPNAWQMIERLEPLHALLVPLDDQQEWFRYHHLFADYLWASLKRGYPDKVSELHVRASQWFKSEGYIAEAARHQRLGGDIDGCALLIEEAGGWEYLLFGGIGQLRNLLRNIPRNQLAKYPRLQLAEAYLALKGGQTSVARGLFEAAELSHTDSKEKNGGKILSGFERDILNMDMLMRIYEDNFRSPDIIEFFQNQLDKVAANDGLTQGIISSGQAVGCLALGRLTDVDCLIQYSQRAMERSKCVVGVNYCFLHGGLAHFHRGHFRKAGVCFGNASRMAKDNFGIDSGLMSVADMLSGVIVYWRDGCQSEKFGTALDNILQNDGWSEIHIAGIDAALETGLASRDTMLTDSIVQKVQRIVNTRNMERMSHILNAYLLRRALQNNDMQKAHQLAHALNTNIGIKCWKTDPFLWRPYQNAGIALACYYSQQDKSVALALLADMIDCCCHFGADFYRIRALVPYSILLDSTGNRRGAVAALQTAVKLAAPEQILTPFTQAPELVPLLASLQREKKNKGNDTLTTNFVTNCYQMLRGPGLEIQTEFSFTDREQEVFQELVRGHTNKEIARSLDMTDHTVKFHLGNIFKKLGVRRRSQAILAARKLNIDLLHSPNG